MAEDKGVREWRNIYEKDMGYKYNNEDRNERPLERILSLYKIVKPSEVKGDCVIDND